MVCLRDVLMVWQVWSFHMLLISATIITGLHDGD
jgi:hypothetical protein